MRQQAAVILSIPPLTTHLPGVPAAGVLAVLRHVCEPQREGAALAPLHRRHAVLLLRIIGHLHVAARSNSSEAVGQRKWQHPQQQRQQP